MTPELIAILAVGVALAGLNLTNHRATRAEIATLRGEIATIRAEINELRNQVAELRERMARLEGLFEGFTQRRPKAAE